MSERADVLKAMKADLEERLEKYHRHQHPEPGSIEKDSAERAVQQQNDDVVNELEVETRIELRQIKKALARLEEGQGEDCERCGEPIHPDRLRVLPDSTLCVKCAAQS